MLYTRDLVAEGSQKFPDLASRLERAEELVLRGHVSPFEDQGARSVKSQSKAGKTYIVKLDERSCTCPDRQEAHAPHGYCKHILAVAMLERLQADNGYDSRGGFSYKDGHYQQGWVEDHEVEARKARRQEERDRLLVDIATGDIDPPNHGVAVALAAGLI